MPVNFPPILPGKRFALIGLNDLEALSIGDALSNSRTSAVRIAADTTMVGISSLAPYDACIVNVGSIFATEAVTGIRPADLERRRVLGILDESEVATTDLAFSHPDWEVIVRPLRVAEVLMRLARLLSRVVTAGLSQPDDGNPRVLAVDDDPTARALLSAVLESAGFKGDCVPNASEALAALAASRFDLVLLDLGMPDIDGFKVLKAIRQNPSDRSPAVVIVSSAAAEDSVLRGFGLGVDDYVTKPFSPRELIARCRRAIRSREPINTGIPVGGSLVPGRNAESRQGAIR